MSEPAIARLRALLLTLTFAAVLPSLGGCILAVAGAAGAGAGYTFSQERSASDQLKDTAIRATVSQSWSQYSYDLAHDLDATVYEGRVLITGRVPKEEWRQEAVQRTWKADGVKEVYDEIEVGADTHFADEARDTVVSTRLRNDILFDGQVKSVNYTIKTEDGVVYIIGSARSEAERNRVMDYARNIPNVRKVVTYVRIRSGEPSQPVASGTAPSAANASAPPASVPVASQDTPVSAPTPRAAIEVTPLK